MSERIYAVLTGDIVESRKLSSGQSKALQERLKSATATFTAVFPDAVVGQLGITRGDGWQVALQQPELALRLALYLRAVVKTEFGTDSRVSIGIGPVDRLEVDNIIESTGPAFEHSGHGLEELGKKRRMAYVVEASDRLNAAEALLVRWLDVLSSAASETQAALLHEVLLKANQERVAQARGVSQSTVSEGLAALGWSEIQQVLQYFENIGNKTDIN